MRELVFNTREGRLVLGGDRAYCNHGHGPFDSQLAVACYCVCHAPMHYESFRAALNQHFGNRDELPRSPLVVDYGCGPSTAYFALRDWLVEHRAGELNSSFIGIDSSAAFREVGARLLDHPALERCAPVVFRESVEALREDEIAEAAFGRDGVIFALSYILHQEFMRDAARLAELFSRVHRHTLGLPTWLLLQDANFPDRPNAVTEIWPEQRLNALANMCAPFGYMIQATWNDKGVISAPHVDVSSRGDFTIGKAGEKRNVCFFFQQIA